jgi:hypothetical protein
MADDAVDTDEIVDDAVETAKIADDAVTLAKLAHGGANKFIGYDGSGVPVEKTVSGGGDMLASTYDPQAIGDDAFDRTKHTKQWFDQITVSSGRSLALTDANMFLRCTTSLTLTLPLNATVAFLTGTQILVHMSDDSGAKVTIDPAVGVTINGGSADDHFVYGEGLGLLTKIATDTWVFQNLGGESAPLASIVNDTGKKIVAFEDDSSGDANPDHLKFSNIDDGNIVVNADGGRTNINIDITPKGSGRLQESGANIPKHDVQGTWTAEQNFKDITGRRKLVTVTGTTKTLALADEGTKQECNNASAQTITLPTNASVAFDVGTEIEFIQKGAGVVTIEGDTGVTVNGTSGGSVDINNQYQGAVAYKTATDEWIISGDIS